MPPTDRTERNIAASSLLARKDDRHAAPKTPLRIPLDVSSNVSCSHELLIRAEMVWRAMVTMHALDLLSCERFARTGRLTPRQVHQIAQDHLALRRPADALDSTVQAVLDRADELQRARGVQTD